MELRLVGLSHKSAPVSARERLAVLSLPRLYARLKEEGCREAVALSTCNRFELYLSGASFAPERGLAVLEELTQTALKEHAYARAGAEAVVHLFSVASGLDSLVVGETEILGQVKAAYEGARLEGMTGKPFNVLFQRALFAGKKVRTETAIAVGQTSTASVAVQLAEAVFGDLRQSEVLLLGAGAMAELSARHLLSRKVKGLSISNRTPSRAAELAARMKARAVAWEEFPAALARADVVISSTGSPEPVLKAALVEAALRERAGRSLFIIDIAMPRDAEEGIHGLDGAYLYRLEDLERIVADNLASREGEVARAGELSASLAAQLWAWWESVAAGREESLRHAGLSEAAGDLPVVKVDSR